MRSVLLALAGTLAFAGSGLSAAGPRPLYGPTDGPITAFAQDGSLFSWFAPGTGTCNTVHVVSLTGVEETLPKTRTRNVTCRWAMGGPAPQLAISAGNGAALWTLHERATTEFDYVVGASAQQPAERRFSEIAHTKAGAGQWLGGIAGNGKTLVYSVAGVAYVNQLACLEGGSCAQRVRGGGIHRVVGRRNVVVHGTGPALQVAAAAGRIAYVPAVTVDAAGQPQASPSRPIEVRNARSGSLVARAKPGGTPVALALSAHVLAVLMHSGAAFRIAWFDALDGRAPRQRPRRQARRPAARGERPARRLSRRESRACGRRRHRHDQPNREDAGEADRALARRQPARLGRERRRPRHDQGDLPPRPRLTLRLDRVQLDDLDAGGQPGRLARVETAGAELEHRRPGTADGRPQSIVG